VVAATLKILFVFAFKKCFFKKFEGFLFLILFQINIFGVFRLL
jgi:hypothetical protein